MICGGWLGFGGDDMNKFLWMVRIAEAQWPTEIVQNKFFAKNGRYEWRSTTISETMEKSTMYRLSYAGYVQLPVTSGYYRCTSGVFRIYFKVRTTDESKKWR